MIKTVIEIFAIILFGIEVYFCAAANQHRRKKLIKGWNPVKGTISSIEKKNDGISGKTYSELTIAGPEDRTVYAKVEPLFCIYEPGEEVDLMELNGVHRFRGNERVDKKGRKEVILGTVPLLGFILIVVLISLIS